MSESENTSASNQKVITDGEAGRRGALGKDHFRFSALEGLKGDISKSILDIVCQKGVPQLNFYVRREKRL